MSSTHLVTGANRGLGLELARQLSARGDQVIATARRPDEAEELRSLDLRVEPLDVADAASVASFISAVGDQPIDVLINNSGMGGQREAFGHLDWDAMSSMFLVNSIGPLRICQSLMPNLRAGSRRLIVNMTSKMGSLADNTSGNAYAYRASKAALNALTKSLAIDLAGEDFCCIVMHPGWVRTDMGGSAAPLSVEDSVQGMLRVIDGLDEDDSGAFYDYAGEAIPW
ncbi:MAG: SDR family oxidoreductase [Acidobacteriota bacterium]